MPLGKRIAATSIVILLVASALALANPFKASSQEAIGIHKVEGAEWHPERGDLLFIAVLGSDVRSGAPGGPGARCDAVHILAINPVKKAGTILNFPRDSYLAIPGVGTRKITEGCFFRGTSGFELVVQALRNHTGIPIQYYVTTEFTHFQALIDDLDGIEVDVPYNMSDPPSGARFRKGPIKMTGRQALAFNRNRKDTPRGDFSRTENQGLFMLASHEKFIGEVRSNPHRLFTYFKAARNHVKITIPASELLELAFLAMDLETKDIKSVNVPGSSGSAGTSSVVFLSPGNTYQRVRDDAIY